MRLPSPTLYLGRFSRFTRKREHAVAFKSMLRRKGIRVVSITEHADDSPTGKLMQAIIESVDDEAVLTYTIPIPSDGVTTESASVLDFVQSSLPNRSQS